MCKVKYAAWAEHDVVIELLRKLVPEFEGPFIKMGIFIGHVIRAHDCRVSSRIATPYPAFFEHRNIFNTVVFSKIKSGGESVATSAYDYNIVMFFRLGVSPRHWPARVAGHGLFDE